MSPLRRSRPGLSNRGRQDSDNPLDAGQLAYCLDIVQQQAFRCKNVINDLLSLSRKDGLEIVNVDVNNLIEIIVGSINFDARGIMVESELLPSLAGGPGGPQRIAAGHCQSDTQCNGCRRGKNGCDDLGTYIFRQGHAEYRGKRQRHRDTRVLSSKRYSSLSLRQRRPRKGSVSGLSLSFEFIKSMNGTISVNSEPGCGTTFIVTLPVATYREMSI